MTQEERMWPVAHIIASIFAILTIAATANAQTASDEPPPFTKSVSFAYTPRDDGLMDKLVTHKEDADKNSDAARTIG